jgi:hypothetical protein
MPKNLKINTLESKQYYDKDEILLHANFQILVDFVEKELHYPNKELKELLVPIDDEDKNNKKTIQMIKNQNNTTRKVINLYNWWKNIRPSRINVWDYNIENPSKKEIEYDKEDDKMLLQLIKLRNFLWT